MWKLDGTVAAIHLQTFSAALDVARPHLGLELKAHPQPGAAVTGHVLQVQFPVPPAADELQEHWTRCDDLIAIYAQTKVRQFQPEVYWRLVRTQDTPAGIELIVSVETSLLDATPATGVSSRMPAGQVLWLNDLQQPELGMELRAGTELTDAHRANGIGLFVFRPAGIGLSYVEMVHPSDFLSASIRWEGETAVLQSQLFHESLEKGVIRRGRVRGVLVAREADRITACQLFREFADSRPPLTT